MRTFEEIREQTNKAQVELLFTDADMALTFLDMAAVTRNEESRERRREEAAKALDFLHARINRVILSPEQETELHRKMSLLEGRLAKWRRA